MQQGIFYGIGFFIEKKFMFRTYSEKEGSSSRKKGREIKQLLFAIILKQNKCVPGIINRGKHQIPVYCCAAQFLLAVFQKTRKHPNLPLTSMHEFSV